MSKQKETEKRGDSEELSSKKDIKKNSHHTKAANRVDQVDHLDGFF